MDGEEQTQTQPTQNVLDPRRIGKQNSGFSDEDISDIVCVLYPHSQAAREEVHRLACEHSPHVVGKGATDHVEPDYDVEDHASRFETKPASIGDHAIVLRLSAHVKNPAAGFAFGRNPGRCDIVFVDDPMKRISNVHFCIYVNPYGNVMIEDTSTNGTSVDRQLLIGRPKNTNAPVVSTRVLSSGCDIMIPVHKEDRDLLFRVRIPRRDAEYDRAYLAKVHHHFARLHLLNAAPDAGRHRTGGHVDLFKTPGEVVTQVAPAGAPRPSTFATDDTTTMAKTEWTGSRKYNRNSTIGKGAFAVVYKVTDMDNGMPYAAKEIEKRRFIKNGVLDQKVETEMRIMQRVKHPNIVRYIENFEVDNRALIIVMELVAGGDLGKLISVDKTFSEVMTQTVAAQLLSALGYLHANKITHRDVKPDNILISSMEPLQVKLTDFGLSKMVTEKTFLRTFCGTLLYLAPEVHTEYDEYDDKGFRSRGKAARRGRGQRYNYAVDIWSLGGVLFFALTGSPPYPIRNAVSHSELLHKIMTTMLNISPLKRRCVSDKGIDFLHRMLQRRPESRATVIELECHPWLDDVHSFVPASQSYDEITDDETTTWKDEPDHVSDSEAEESQDVRPRRLFGEVSPSAMGSSGVLPADYLGSSMGETEILQPHADDSGDSDTRDGPRHYYLKATSDLDNQSTDPMQSLVDDVASQSLGGDGAKEEPRSSGQDLSQSLDPNSSKRKPPLSDPSGDVQGGTSLGQPTMKRLKSQEADVTDEVRSEYLLLASIPQVRRLGSGRQVDNPVDKVVFWERDMQTWHLDYPEMTQLQLDAFFGAARSRGEEFGPGQTPLWDLAMKHFPPRARPSRRQLKDEAVATMPSTAAGEAVPEPERPPDSQIVVPVPVDARAIAVVESLPDSVVRNMSVPITDSLVSFGRGPDNTEIFRDRLESRVPKYAFKILLWKEGYDPSSKTLPWKGSASAADASYHFWISTKATLGILINGHHLASSDATNAAGPAKHWAKIYDGDSLMIWGRPDPEDRTHVVFRCFWGGSSRKRPQGPQLLELADGPLAQRLDAACQRTENRVRLTMDRRRRTADAEKELEQRLLQVEQERRRGDAFEKTRLAAVEYLTATQQLPSRLAAPRNYLPSRASRLQATATMPFRQGR
ncbi:hypothetical protein XA68_18482 [Ophiocordyceps unilateralis]|uniref:Autophagy-related protein 1 n=1 Tax=Ophiocordyceps unilateralis TaxID=268505 RepID=A0A2A9P3C5_OPHUN|nr:hypothetical protein XA68_18482 [Ophiocordyceps unilateralis]